MNMFGKTPAPVSPTPTAPPPMPDPFSPEAAQARKNAMAAQAKGGRSSTILTTAASRANPTIAGAAVPSQSYASRSLGGG